jgi:hypothetical protein
LSRVDPAAAILEHIQELVDGAVGEGRCHLGTRRFPSPEMLLASAEDATLGLRIHYYQVARGPFDAEATSRANTIGINTRTYPITIDGWREVKDPAGEPDATEIGTVMQSEVDFSAEANEVTGEIDDDASLHGGSLAVSCTPVAEVAWDLSTMELPGDGTSEPEQIECHHVTLTFAVEVRVGVDRS